MFLKACGHLTYQSGISVGRYRVTPRDIRDAITRKNEPLPGRNISDCARKLLRFIITKCFCVAAREGRGKMGRIVSIVTTHFNIDYILTRRDARLFRRFPLDRSVNSCRKKDPRATHLVRICEGGNSSE